MTLDRRQWQSAGLLVVALAASVALLALSVAALSGMAYQHKALSDVASLRIQIFLSVLEWPRTFAADLGPAGIGYFEGSHVEGSDFWSAIITYLVLLTAGWSIVFGTLWPLWRWTNAMLRQNEPDGE